jgi:cation:H+ antiporter
LGTLAGSNLLNLSLILGLVAAVGEIRVSASVIRREVRLAVAAVVGFGALVWLGLTVWTAVVLLVALLAAVWMLVRWGRGDQSPSPESRPSGGRRRRLAELARAGLGLAGLLVGAEILVSNASAVAERLGVAPGLIGFTVLALGTSLPELVTAVAAQRRGQTDLVVGNLFGSNLFNSLAGGAIVGFANGRVVHHAATAALVAMALTAVLAWALILRGQRVTRTEGALLLTVYLLTIPLVAVGPPGS